MNTEQGIKPKIQKIRVEIVFLIIGLIAGILFCIFIPYGAGFDEEAHLVRIYDISRGNLVPNRVGNEGSAFLEFFSLSYQRKYLQTPASNLFEPETFLTKGDKSNMTDAKTISTYSPTVFLVEAFAAGLAWRIFNLPIIPAVIGIRLAGLFLYLLMGFLTIRLLPIGKWLMAVLLLAPMALFQASTLNGDKFTIAASALFVAVILRSYSNRETPINVKESLMIAGAALLLGFAKPGTIILLPLMLLLLKNKTTSRKSLAIIITGIVLSVAYSIGWSFLAVLGTTVKSTGQSRSYQILLVLNHFGEFLKVYFTGVFHILPKYYTDWVAEYGYWAGQVPSPVYILFPLALLAAYFAEGNNPKILKSGHWIMLAVALFCLAIIASVKFVWGFIPGELFFGSQGRYFLPFAPLLFLTFAGIFEPKQMIKTSSAILVVGLIIGTLALYGFGLYRTYYTVCVNAVDKQHPCTLPIYRNFDVDKPAVVNLSANTTLEQGFDPECGPINSIDLQFLATNNALSGNLKLSLFDPSHVLLAQSEIPISKVSVGQTTHFPFKDVQVHGSRIYSFQLEMTDTAKTDQTLALMAAKEDRYGKGTLLVNGTPPKGAADLYFQFECAQ
jgi:uncharacterized membrane protein